MGRFTVLVAACVVQSDLITSTHGKAAVESLANAAVGDPAFPCQDLAHRELYDWLYTGILTAGDVNEFTSRKVLRLAEARLDRDPAQCEAIGRELSAWFARPVAALEGCVQDALELLADYGQPGGMLADWYRRWVGALLELPRGRDRASLSAWLLLGTWIQPGEDLLAELRKAQDTLATQLHDDLVADLPVAYRIGIFSFRERAAERARGMLLERNSGLDIRICTERDLNDQAKALARGVQAAIVVTTCVSHALTYGIEPYLHGTPIFPISSGSTSIVRSFEEYLRSSHAKS